MRWKDWTNISKKYIIGVTVYLLWACQPQEHAYVTEMYEVMNQISEGTLQADGDPGWDFSTRGNMEDFYWIDSRYG